MELDEMTQVPARGLVNKWLTIVGLVVLTFATDAVAANWYVRPGGTGSKTGQDWNNAWDTGGIGWSSVSGGDTIWLAGGAYSKGVNFTKSGSSGNFIYLKRVLSSDSVPTSAAGWSSSFDSQVSLNLSGGQDPFGFNNNNIAYIYIDGRVKSGIFGKYDNAANALHGGVNITASGCNNITVVNAELCGPGTGTYLHPVEFNYQGDNAPICIRGTGTRTHDLTFSYCILHGGPNLIYCLGNVDNMMLDHCTLYDNASGNSAIHANILYNNGPLSNWTVRYCDISGWQVEGFGIYGIGSASPWYVYGNIVHDAGTAGSYPSFFWPGSDSGTSPQGPVYLYNNTFVGIDITTSQGRSGPFASGSQARNNIYWNSSLAGNSSISDSDYNFSNGSTAGSHSVGSGASPFVSSSAQDYHILSTVAANLPRNKGTALSPVGSATVTLDADGNTRGSDGSWDIGAYEYSTGVTTTTNPVIAVNPTSMSFGPVAAGQSATNTFTVQNSGNGTLSGSASVPSASAGFLTIISGGSYSLGAGQSQVVTVRYSPSGASTDSGSITCTGGGGTQLSVTGSLLTALGGLTFPSSAGVISGPFTIGNGYLSQTVDVSSSGAAGISSGGQAVFTFTVPTAGTYTISASVNAPDSSTKSFWVNIDGMPTDPTMIWDVYPYTSGMETRTVSWRGTGTPTADQYSPQIFTLSAGTHQLIIVGREANVQLGQITIVPNGAAPPPPQNLHIVSGG